MTNQNSDNVLNPPTVKNLQSDRGIKRLGSRAPQEPQGQPVQLEGGQDQLLDQTPAQVPPQPQQPEPVPQQPQQQQGIPEGQPQPIPPTAQDVPMNPDGVVTDPSTTAPTETPMTRGENPGEIQGGIYNPAHSTDPMPTPEDRPNQPVPGAENLDPTRESRYDSGISTQQRELAQQVPDVYTPHQIDSNNYYRVGNADGMTLYDPLTPLKLDILDKQNQLDVFTLLNAQSGRVFIPDDLVLQDDTFTQGVDAAVNPMMDRVIEAQKKRILINEFGANWENYELRDDGTVVPKTNQLAIDMTENRSQSATGGMLSWHGMANNRPTPSDEQDWGIGTDLGNMINLGFSKLESLGDKDIEQWRSEEKTPWWQKARGVALTQLSWVTNPIGNLNETFRPEHTERYRAEQARNLEGTAKRLEPTKFAPGKGQWGDYGSAGALSAGIYALNLGESVVGGVVYEVIDRTIQKNRLGRDPYKGNRIQDAFLGRDFSFFNRATEENYLGILQPEDLRTGQLADSSNLPETIFPISAGWYNWSENAVVNAENAKRKVFGQDPLSKEEAQKLRSSRMTENLEWVVQNGLGLASSFVLDTPADKLTGSVSGAILKRVSGAADDLVEGALEKTVKESVRQADDVVDGGRVVTRRVVDETHGVLPKDAPSVTIDTKTNRVVITEPNGQFDVVLPLKEEPSGRILQPENALKSDTVQLYSNPATLSDSPRLNKNLDFSVRDNDQLTTVARTVTLPNEKTPITSIGRQLTENEASVLSTIDPHLFGKIGQPLDDIAPVLDEGTHVIDDLGRAFEIKKPPVGLTDDILGITSENASRTYKRLRHDVNMDYVKYSKDIPDTVELAKHDRRVAKMNISLARAADDGDAYKLIREELPNDLNVPTANDIGGRMVNHQIAMKGDTAEIVRLDRDINLINRELDKVEGTMKVYPPLQRGDLTLEQLTKQWGTEVPHPERRILGNDGLKPLQAERVQLVERLDIETGTVNVRKYGTNDTVNVPQEWLHGTASHVDLRRVDTVKGGSPSEFGLGVYLTDDIDTAFAAGTKGDLPNRPFVSARQVHSQPLMHKIDVSRVDNVLDGEEKLGRGFRKMWEDAADGALVEVAKQSPGTLKPGERITFQQMFDDFQIQYYQKFGTPPTAETVRRFQQKLTTSLTDAGVEGMHVNRNGVRTMVVYKPEALKVIETSNIKRTNKLSESLESRRYLDKRVHQQLGDDVTKADYAVSRKRWLDYQHQQLVEQKIRKEVSLAENTDELLKAQEELADLKETMTRKELERTRMGAEYNAEQLDQPTRKLRNDLC